MNLKFEPEIILKYKFVLKNSFLYFLLKNALEI